MVSELVTNAVNAGCVHGRVGWSLHSDQFRIEVFDDAPGWPILQHPAATDAHGRGLQIVQALTRDCGTESLPDGKLSWALLLLGAVA